MSVEEIGRKTGEESSKKGSKSEVMRSESLNDQPSPRGVLEMSDLGSDSDTSSCSNSSSYSPKKLAFLKSNRDYNGLQWKTIIDTIKKKSTRRFSVIPLLTSYEMSRKNLRRKLAKLHGSEEEEEINIDCIPVAKPSWKNFSYAELSAAADNFSPGKQLITF